MRRVEPLARAVLNVTKYTALFSFLGLLVLGSAAEISFVAERSLSLVRAVEQLMNLPFTAALAALLAGLPMGMLLGVAVAIALAVFHRSAPNQRRLRFTVELIALLAVLPGTNAVSDSMHTLVGAPARLLAAASFVLPLIAMRWGRLVADRYFDDLRRLEWEYSAAS